MDIKTGDVIEYLGVRYLVFHVTDEEYVCMNGYDFSPYVMSKDMRIRKIDDLEEATVAFCKVLAFAIDEMIEIRKDTE